MEENKTESIITKQKKKIAALRKSLGEAREYLEDIAVEPNGSGFDKSQHAREGLELVEWSP